MILLAHSYPTLPTSQQNVVIIFNITSDFGLGDQQPVLHLRLPQCTVDLLLLGLTKLDCLLISSFSLTLYAHHSQNCFAIDVSHPFYPTLKTPDYQQTLNDQKLSRYPPCCVHVLFTYVSRLS